MNRRTYLIFTAIVLAFVAAIIPSSTRALRQAGMRTFLPVAEEAPTPTAQATGSRGLFAIFGIPTPWDSLFGGASTTQTITTDESSSAAEIDPDDPWAGRPEPLETGENTSDVNQVVSNGSLETFTPTPTPSPTAVAIPSYTAVPSTTFVPTATSVPSISTTTPTATPQQFIYTQPTTLSGVCQNNTDDVARQMELKLNRGTVEVVKAARFEGIGDQGESIKKVIDSRRFGTGGPVRDIYQSGGESIDITRRLEDYLRDTTPVLRDQVQQQSVTIAANVSKAVTNNLLSPLNLTALTQGSVTTTRSVTTWSEEKVTTLGYDLKKRSGLWGFKTFGRAEFRFTSKAEVSVTPIAYTTTFQACNGQVIEQQSVKSAVTVTPSVTVEYVISPRDNSRPDTLRGTVRFVNPQQDAIYQVISLASNR